MRVTINTKDLNLTDPEKETLATLEKENQSFKRKIKRLEKKVEQLEREASYKACEYRESCEQNSRIRQAIKAIFDLKTGWDDEY